jgi:hypothetical protein
MSMGKPLTMTEVLVSTDGVLILTKSSDNSMDPMP